MIHTLQNLFKRWYKEKTVEDNTLAVVKNLIHYINAPVLNKTIETELKTHSQYPSLKSISDCLSSWNIYNQAFKIDKNRIYEIKFPAIGYFYKSSTFIMIHSIKEDSVNFIDTKTGWKALSINQFKEEWDGTVLMVECLNCREDNYTEKKIEILISKITISLFFLFILSLLANFIFYISNQSFNILWILTIILIKIIGLFICYGLLKIEINDYSTMLNKICLINEHFDCKAILNSKLSKIGGFSLAEFGFFYFCSSFLILVLSPFFNVLESSFLLLKMINYPLLLISIFLVLYQKIQIKKFCIFCLAVNLLFWIEFVLMLNVVKININLYSFLLFPLCLIVSIVLWFNYKKQKLQDKNLMNIIKTKNYYEQNIDLIRHIIKNSPLLFNTIIYDDEFIIKNDKKTEESLIIIIDPLCKHCSKIYKQFLLWYSSNPEVNIIIRFQYTNELSLKVINHVLALVKNETIEKCLIALNDWFESDDKSKNFFYKWTKIYKSDVVYNIDVSEKIRQWIELNKIYYTPAFIVNERIIPYYVNFNSLTNFYKRI